MPAPTLSRHRRAGFSLVELMVSVALSMIVIVGASSFVLGTGRMVFITGEKFRVNEDIRSLTNQMTDIARDANHFIIYPDFHADKDRPQYSDETGDLLVLIFQDEDYPTGPGMVRRINRVVGYYRERDDNNRGPVRRFDTDLIWPTGIPHPTGSLDFPRTAQPLSIQQILQRPEITQGEADFPVVVQLARGLAHENLFFNHLGRSVVVNGQIIRGSVVREVADTYNFTISPRG